MLCFETKKIPTLHHSEREAVRPFERTSWKEFHDGMHKYNKRTDCVCHGGGKFISLSSPIDCHGFIQAYREFLRVTMQADLRNAYVRQPEFTTSCRRRRRLYEHCQLHIRAHARS